MMMSDPLISIIIPVYNAERYLRRCLDSVLNQSFKDWEAILVDDGSKDGSGIICDEYVAMDNRFHVLHKENGGVCTARNLGLDVSCGKWIEFLDADDWIDLDTFEKLASCMSLEHCDSLYFDFIHHYEDRDERYHTPESDSKLGLLNKFILGEWTISVNIVAKKNLYEENRIRYDSSLSFNEDYNVAMKVLVCSNVIRKVPGAFYHYDMTNANSAMHGLTSQRYYSEGLISQVDVIEYFKSKNVYRYCRRSFKERLLKNNQWMLVDSNAFDLFRTYCGPCPDFLILSYFDYSLKQRLIGYMLLKHWYAIPRLLVHFRNRK